MRYSGETEDRKPVVADIAVLSTTYGLPLEITLQYLKDRDWVVDWPDYITHCLNDGHNPSTIRARLKEAIADVFGPRYSKEFMSRLDRFMPVESGCAEGPPP
jgi:predicted RNase H-like HicB family nuclease